MILKDRAAGPLERRLITLTVHVDLRSPDTLITRACLSYSVLQTALPPPKDQHPSQPAQVVAAGQIEVRVQGRAALTRPTADIARADCNSDYA